jgi:predicted nucleic acid-binding protein
MTTLIDSNVLLDVFNPETLWFAWSSDALTQALDSGPIVINAVVYAETSVRFSRSEDFDAALAIAGVTFEDVTPDAAFLAAKAFLAYRRDGGPRTTLLPDFLIGAHAAVRGYTLLTRDARRFRAYYPRLKLIAPR